MSDNRMQKCLVINKSNIDIIGKALEEYWSCASHDARAIHEINDARVAIRDIKEQMEKLTEVKICWG